jgi:WD40 repeat protein
LAFSADGKTLCSGDDAIVSLWQTTELRQTGVIRTNSGSVSSMVFAPDGKNFVATFLNKTVTVVDPRAKRIAAQFQGPAVLTASRHCAVFCPKTRVVCVGDSVGRVWVWSLRESTSFDEFRASERPVYCASVSPRQKLLAMGYDDPESASGTSAAGIGVWNLDPGVQRAEYGRTAPPTKLVGFGQGSAKLAAAGTDNAIRVWDLGAGRVGSVLLPSTGTLQEIGISKDGEKLASANASGEITIWNTTSGKQICTFARSPDRQSGGGARRVTSLAFAPDNAWIISAYHDGIISIWETDTGRLINSLPAHTSPVSGLAFSPDRKLLATCGSDGSLKLLLVDGWRVQRTLAALDLKLGGPQLSARRGLIGLTFSPDGRKLARILPYGLAVAVWELSPDGLLFVVESRSEVLAFDFLDDRSIVMADRGGWVTHFHVPDPR